MKQSKEIEERKRGSKEGKDEGRKEGRKEGEGKKVKED